MADEEKEPVEEISEEVKKVKKGSSKKSIVLGLVILVLCGGGFVGWKYFLAEKFSQSHGSEKDTTDEALKSPGIMYKMEPFIVNLFDQGGKRYLKTQFEIEADSEKVNDEVRKRLPQLRDAVLLLLSSKSFSDIGVPGGKVELRTEMVEKINSILKSGTIRTLYFTEFVVQ